MLIYVVNLSTIIYFSYILPITKQKTYSDDSYYSIILLTLCVGIVYTIIFCISPIISVLLSIIFIIGSYHSNLSDLMGVDNKLKYLYDLEKNHKSQYICMKITEIISFVICFIVICLMAGLVFR
jgi:hypothetical protein